MLSRYTVNSGPVFLITGVSGFVGKTLCTRLLKEGRRVRGAVRSFNQSAGLRPDCERVFVGEIGPETDWGNALQGIDTVVHLAARVHVMRDAAHDLLCEFRRINVAGTLNLARSAAAAGVRRFVYLSSVKVNGEETKSGRAFTEEDNAAPEDAYAISKYEAEQGLRQLANKTGLEVVIVRSPLVYGPGVKANFMSMMQWLNRGVPLPFGLVRNRRSLVALDNLVDLIVVCLEHPAAANQTFFVADGEDLSTPELLRRMGKALGKSVWLLPVPMWMLKAGAAMLRNRGFGQRLCGSLQVDISKARIRLGWDPPQKVEQGLLLTARYFLEHACIREYRWRIAGRQSNKRGRNA